MNGSGRASANGVEQGGCYTRVRDPRATVGATEQRGAGRISVRTDDARVVHSVRVASRGIVRDGNVTGYDRDVRRAPGARSGGSGRTGLSSNLHALRDDCRLLRGVSYRIHSGNRDHPSASNDGWWRVHRSRPEAPQPEREHPRSTPSFLSDPPAPADSSDPRVRHRSVFRR